MIDNISFFFKKKKKFKTFFSGNLYKFYTVNIELSTFIVSL